MLLCLVTRFRLTWLASRHCACPCTVTFTTRAACQPWNGTLIDVLAMPVIVVLRSLLLLMACCRDQVVTFDWASHTNMLVISGNRFFLVNLGRPGARISKAALMK
jgi:hypothetical protein